MGEFNLLQTYPKAIRDVAARLADKEKNRRIALEFGMEYFDGTREQGYGGYVYDGRWIPIARAILDRYHLGPGDRVLDVGCAKGFLMKDLLDCCPGLEVRGLEISHYAIENCHSDVVGLIDKGNVRSLPYEDGSFDFVSCINVVHNLDHEDCIQAIREVERVASGGAFIQVDAYRSDDERSTFLDWVLTAKTHGDPQYWRTLFEEAGYTGDYYWTIMETDKS
jgi:SAM-dependent methyltransferase